MKIKTTRKDFRGNEVFIVKGDDKTIQDHFYNKYPSKDICILEHLNSRGTFEVTIMPKEVYLEEETQS